MVAARDFLRTKEFVAEMLGINTSPRLFLYQPHSRDFYTDAHWEGGRSQFVRSRGSLTHHF